MPSSPDSGSALQQTPVGAHGSLGQRQPWQQRAQQRTPFHRLVLIEARKHVATTAERLGLLLGVVVLLVVTALCAFLVNTDAPDTAAFQLFGLVLAGHMAPVLLYAAILRSFSSEWYYRTIELTRLFHPGRVRNAAAQLAVLFGAGAVVSLLQFALYFAVRPGLAGMPLRALGVALLTGALTVLLVLAIGLLIANPTGAALCYVVVSVLLLARVVNPLVLRWFDPWQLSSYAAGSVIHVFPGLTALAVLLLLNGVGFALARNR